MNHVGYIEEVVAFGNLNHSVGVVAVVVAILHCHLVGGVDGKLQIIQAAVAGHGDCAGEVEHKVIHIVLCVTVRCTSTSASRTSAFSMFTKKLCQDGRRIPACPQVCSSGAA